MEKNDNYPSIFEMEGGHLKDCTAHIFINISACQHVNPKYFLFNILYMYIIYIVSIFGKLLKVYGPFTVCI